MTVELPSKKRLRLPLQAEEQTKHHLSRESLEDDEIEGVVEGGSNENSSENSGEEVSCEDSYLCDSDGDCSSASEEIVHAKRLSLEFGCGKPPGELLPFKDPPCEQGTSPRDYYSLPLLKVK
eukprot:GHVU01016995.1.p1 GENE.GHVU01016995.1~~GHVU01016995.1.p1  ORF type:complete len:143 (+),score=20.74 GHVU01016995.1:64-429(+)